MVMKNSRSLSYLAEYQYGDDNILTATYHEELRLRNEARVRGAQPALRLQDLTLSDDSHAINKAKRVQQELDRKEAIERHNLLLLNKLERIHEQQVPSQFDVSHHSRTVLDAPRLTNQHRRRREDERIAAENSALARRLRQAKGSFSNKQLAADAERHQYLSDQISKVQRRDKVRHKCQSLASSAALKRDAAQQQQQHVASPNNMLAVSKEDEREYVLVALQPKPQQLQRGQVEAGSPSVPLGSSPSPAPATRRLREDALPSVMPRGKAHELLAGPPTVTNTSKLISAKELLRTRHSIRTLSNA